MSIVTQAIIADKYGLRLTVEQWASASDWRAAPSITRSSRVNSRSLPTWMEESASATIGT